MTQEMDTSEPIKTIRESVEELLIERGWVFSTLSREYFIPGIARRPRGAPGHAGSLLEALRQEIEREAEFASWEAN